MKIVHFQGLSTLNMQKDFLFMLNFEHVNFAINGKYSQIFFGNPNYYVSLVIFQTYKIATLKSVHSFDNFFTLVHIVIHICNYKLTMRRLP